MFKWCFELYSRWVPLKNADREDGFIARSTYLQ